MRRHQSGFNRKCQKTRQRRLRLANQVIAIVAPYLRTTKPIEPVPSSQEGEKGQHQKSRQSVICLIKPSIITAHPDTPVSVEGRVPRAGGDSTFH